MKYLALLSLICLFVNCSKFERDNPWDPASSNSPDQAILDSINSWNPDCELPTPEECLAQVDSIIFHLDSLDDLNSDTLPPLIEYSTEIPDTIKTNSFIISGTIKDSSGIKAFTLNSFTVDISDSTWSIVYDFTIGQNLLIFTAIDDSENQNTRIDSFTVIRVLPEQNPPVLNIQEPNKIDTVIQLSPIKVSGSVTDDTEVSTVKVNNKQVEIKEGAWSTSVLLDSIPLNIINITATDIYGNQSRDTILIYYLPGSPGILFELQDFTDSSIYSTPSIKLKVKVTPKNTSLAQTSPVKIDNKIALRVTGTSDIYTSEFFFTKTGFNEIKVTAKDQNNNESVQYYYFSYDTTGPVLVSIQPADSQAFVDSSVLFEIISESALGSFPTSQIMINNEECTYSESDNKWTLNYTPDKIGVNDVTIKATDEGGNFSINSRTFFYDPTLNDHTPPEILYDSTSITPSPLGLGIIDTTSDSLVTIKFTATDESGISQISVILLSDPETKYTPTLNNGVYTLTLNMSVGLDTISLTAIDGSTNTNTLVDNFIIYREVLPRLLYVYSMVLTRENPRQAPRINWTPTNVTDKRYFLRTTEMTDTTLVIIIGGEEVANVAGFDDSPNPTELEVVSIADTTITAKFDVVVE